MHKCIWHISWEDTRSTSGGLGVASSELVDALPNTHHHISAVELLGGGGSSYSSYCSEIGLRSVDWEHVLSTLVSGQLSNPTGVSHAAWRFNMAILGLKRDSLIAVHIHDWHGILAGVALKRILKIPLILHFHSTQKERLGDHVDDFISGLEQWGATQADHVICVSKWAAHNIVRNSHFSSSKLSIVHNSSRFKNIIAAKSTCREVVFVGRLCDQKHPLFILELVRELLKRSPDYTFTLIGEGDQKGVLYAVAEFYEIRDVIRWLPFQQHSDISNYYQNAGMLCLPSNAEPFGLVALEAARMGIPVILSQNCGVSELLGSALVLNNQQPSLWAEKIDALFNDECAYQKLITALQKEAASYTWQDAAENVLAIYAKLLN